MAQDKEELKIPMGQEEEEPEPMIDIPKKVKTSNLDDDLGNQLTPAEKEDLTDGGETTLHSHALSAHASSHQSGGSDEINVSGLSGELADNQPPKAHASSHESGGSDEIDLTGLKGGAVIKTFTAGGSITAGKAVAIIQGGTYGGRVVEASADSEDVAYFIGFAMTSASSGNPVDVMCYGVKGGFSGLSLGSIYYVADTTQSETETISQTSHDSDANVESTYYYQSFKPTKNLITAVSILIKDTENSSDQWSVGIWRTIGDGPINQGGSPSGYDIGTTYGWHKCVFTKAALCAVGETLYIGVSGNSVISGARWAYNSGGGYADGFLSTDGQTPIGDAAFKVYEKDSEGEIATSAGTHEKKVGIAISSTELLIIQSF